MKTSEKYLSMAEAVRQVIDRMEVGTQFHGNELKNMVVRIFPKARYMYVDTIQRAMRKWRRDKVKCICNHKSLYEVVK